MQYMSGLWKNIQINISSYGNKIMQAIFKEKNKPNKNDKYDSRRNNIRTIEIESCPRCETYLEVLDDIECSHCKIPIIWTEMYVAMEGERNEE